MYRKYETYDKILTFAAFQQPQPRESRLMQINLKGHYQLRKKNKCYKL